MTIACVRIPSFAAALVRHHTPALRRQPLLLWTAQRQRLLVYAACADAARAGVRVGALLRQAQLHCPQAAALPATPQRDQQTFAALVQALEMLSPQLHVDTFLPHAAATLDLADIQRRPSTALIQQLHTTLRASVPLPAAVGLGPSRVVAQVAARAAGKHGSVVVAPEDARRFLAPQPLRWLPQAAPLLAPLAQLGITTMGAFAALPPDAVVARFSVQGTALLRQCQGFDPEPAPAAPQALPSIHVRSRFAGAVDDRTTLDRALAELARRLARQLKQGGVEARHLTLSVTVAGALPSDTTRVLSAPTASAAKLADSARALLTTTSTSAGVLALALTAEHVQPLAAQQLSLFPADPTPGEALPPVLSRLKARYGPGRLLRARISDPDAHLWEQRVLFAEWEDA